MNPFLNDTIARPAPRADFAMGRLLPAGRRFVGGVAGRLAVAGGLALVMASSAHALDANSASAEQLESLRGIGPKTARIIVQERQRGGRFESIEDLSDRVRGIGPKRAQSLQAAGLTVGGSPAAGTPAGAPRPVPARLPGRP
ncbi:DUF655 domain-containing protein [Bordetella sp. FB-8]|uniref:ComEA family DNA-binding protein n=1 Tax=Bordetella sp. FB-8 TaxID=1159870 RepID=UPI0003A35BC0|nr:DUF655 domain-containing protein [Bordetella sp. FB-8]